MPTADTLVSLFADRHVQTPERVALHCKRDGTFQPTSWGELARDVHGLAAWLVNQGVAPGDRVVQVSENRYEWIVADLAIQVARGIHVPVHAPLAGDQIAVQIQHSGARVVLLSTDDQAAKLTSLASLAQYDCRYFSYDETARSVGGGPVEGLPQAPSDDLCDAGRDLEQRALSELGPSSVATILYTSGTTGEPKGVMLSHNNLVTNTLATLEAFDQSPDDLRLTFLPLSHVFARTCDLYSWLAVGAQLALAESRDTVVADCAAVQPTLLNGVPYFFDKVMRVLIEKGLGDDSSALHGLLGGSMRLCCSGGAALPDHVYDFYNRHGLPVLQGYGLSETSPVITVSPIGSDKRGSAGRPITDVEVRIAEDGEILTRGPHVMLGYYQNQAATDDIIRDGWLYTGDLGHLDDDGFLFITGRKKELIVTAAGKNVAPVYLESLLTEDPLILQAVVLGDGRNYLTALIVPDPDVLKREIVARGISVLSRDQALRHADVVVLYETCVAERLSNVSHHEQVRRFTLMDRGFTIESGELTPKLSLRRKVIEENCRDQIEAMYAG